MFKRSLVVAVFVGGAVGTVIVDDAALNAPDPCINRTPARYPLNGLGV
jgi:hypothetical protein